MKLACNRTVQPDLALPDFLAMVRNSGATAVEIRNDILGHELADGSDPARVRDKIGEAGLSVASVNALQRFNDWTPERADEARATFQAAAALGAPGVVLCPVIDPAFPTSANEKRAKLKEALTELRSLAEETGVRGYVEPLGMTHSTLKHQVEAVEVIDTLNAFGPLQLCYDTFQFFRCGDTRLFPEHIGLVHISGITRTDRTPAELDEPDRGLVGEYDRVDNLERLRDLADAGYDGYVSMEPFDPKAQSDPALSDALAKSLDHVTAQLQKYR